MDLFFSASYLSIKFENNFLHQLDQIHLKRHWSGARKTCWNLLTSDSFDVDDPFPTVNLNEFPLPTLEGSRNDLDLIVLANGHEVRVVLVAEVGGEWCTHQHSSDTQQHREVSLPTLPAGAWNSHIVLHLHPSPLFRVSLLKPSMLGFKCFVFPPQKPFLALFFFLASLTQLSVFFSKKFPLFFF